VKALLLLDLSIASHPERSLEREGAPNAVEGSALKIGREMLNLSAVILNAVKDPQLHFHGLGWNAIPCPTAVAFQRCWY
jgi:hypothetical protein